MEPPVQLQNYIQFTDLKQVNQLIGNWHVKPALIMRDSKAVVTLELYEDDAYVIKCQCLTNLLDHVVCKEGMRWAQKQGIII